MLRAPISIHEPMQPKDADSGLTFSMEGYVGDKTTASMIPFAWSAGWNSPQAWNKLQDKVGGRLKGGDIGIRLFDGLPKSDTTFEKLSVGDSLTSSIFDGRADKLLALVEIPERQKVSDLIDWDMEKPVIRKKYIPPFDSIWRITNTNLFKKQTYFF